MYATNAFRALVLFLSVALLTEYSIAAGQFGMGGVLQPKHYLSQSGAFDLYVDPGDWLGHGSANYEVRHEGQLAWNGEKAFTFWEAAVSNSGNTLGYAYSNGPDGGRDDGDFRVVILSGKGSILCEEVRERGYSRIMHSPPVPLGRGLFIQDESEKGVIRVGDDEGEEWWWVYDIESGKALEKIQPKKKIPNSGPVGHIVRAVPVPDTPLTLINWTRYEWGPRKLGVRFSLLDSEWDSVWELDLPTDYNIDGDEEAEDRLSQKMRYDGAILEVLPGGGFELRIASEAARVTYRAEVIDSKWAVHEVSRREFVEQEPTQPEVNELSLRLIASVPLGTAASEPQSAIRDIVEFAADAGGVLRFIRREKQEGHYSVVRLDAEGVVTNEVPFGPIGLGEYSLTWAPLTKDDWLLTVSEYGSGGKSTAWVIDGLTGGERQLEGFDCPHVEELVATAEGGFVALASYRHKYSSDEALLCFDKDGEQLWKVGSRHGVPSMLFSPEDVAVIEDGSVVVLENISNAIRVYSPTGEFVKVIELEEAFGQEPNYLSGISAAPGGGMFVHDFNGEPSLWLLTSEGVVRSKFGVADPENMTAGRLERQAQFSPDGILWATDRRVFVQLDEQGVVKKLVGETPAPESLNEPGALAIDGRGHVLVQDERTANVHVFNQDGDLVRLCLAAPEDVELVSIISTIFASAEGDVFVEGDNYPHHEYIEFNAHGVRQGIREFPAPQVSFAPAGDEFWIANHDGLQLIGSDGTVTKSVARLPNNLFFIGQVSVAADGSLAFCDSHHLAHYDPGLGESGRLLEVPDKIFRGHFAWSGRWGACAFSDPDVYLVDTRDGSYHHFILPEHIHPRISWEHGFSPDGTELWLVQEKPLTLHRYALP